MSSLGDLVREQVEAQRALVRARCDAEAARLAAVQAAQAVGEARLRYNTACAAVDKAVYDEVRG